MGSRDPESESGNRAPLRRLDPERAGDHIDRLFRAAWAMCGDRDLAEELVQETYARVLAKPRWLRRDDDLAYLLKAMRNTHVSLIRKRQRRPGDGGPQAVELDEDQTADPSAGSNPAAALDAKLMFEAIAELPENLRLAVVAVDVAGLSYREAAKVLKVSEASVTSRLHRARLQLADTWNDQGSERNRGHAASG